MILPIIAFGTPVLKNKTKNIDKDYEGYQNLSKICLIQCMKQAGLV